MPWQVVMLGTSGAVGYEVVKALCARSAVAKLALLNRRPLNDVSGAAIKEHIVDVLNPQTYKHLLSAHQCTVCTLGVGQPSVVSDAEFVRFDKDAVIGFAQACKEAGVAHFELLSSIGADARSRSLYLRTKGELCDALVALGFDRLSLFQPSMILTPTNRYGVLQGLTLTLRPKLDAVLQGSWRKYRGVTVTTLGAAMAANRFTNASGVEWLNWTDFHTLTARDDPNTSGCSVIANCLYRRDRYRPRTMNRRCSCFSSHMSS
jgi:uncharacterized protein YbjT (DUF2867 family)